jgi:hypothetical protein
MRRLAPLSFSAGDFAYKQNAQSASAARERERERERKRERERERAADAGALSSLWENPLVVLLAAARAISEREALKTGLPEEDQRR